MILGDVTKTTVANYVLNIDNQQVFIIIKMTVWNYVSKINILGIYVKNIILTLYISKWTKWKLTILGYVSKD